MYFRNFNSTSNTKLLFRERLLIYDLSYSSNAAIEMIKWQDKHNPHFLFIVSTKSLEIHDEFIFVG